MLASPSTFKTVDDSSPYNQFKYSVCSQLTRKYYERRIKKFFDSTDFENELGFEARFDRFARRGTEDNDWATRHVIHFLRHEVDRVQRGDIAAATLRNFVKAMKLLCEICEIPLNWKRITRGFPRARSAASDRAPTVQEIKRLIEYPDRRIKPIIYTMASSGIRIGAWDFLKWKHIKPMYGEDGKISVARMTVYETDPEEYFTFITPEAYYSLKDWIEFRASHGEKITGESWVMRDIWQTSNMKYGAKFGLATNPKKLKSSGIKRLIEHALWEQGLRSKLEQGIKRHEWKAAHGFRKFFKTRAEQIMKPINVELLMGHNIGLSASYYRPKENEIMEDYLKAHDYLTINADQDKLVKKIEELTEKSEDSEVILKLKLSEKDRQLKSITEKYDSKLGILTQAVTDMQELLKHAQIKQLN